MVDSAQLLRVVRLLVVGSLLAVAAAAQETSDRLGYYLNAKITRVNADGTIDFWITSAQALPRAEPVAAPGERPQLPKVIATLELKEAGVVSRGRNAGLMGSRISLRGDCEDLERATRVPVLQVRLGTGERWQQASLEPFNRAGCKGFAEIVIGVCGPEAASPPVPAELVRPVE